MPLARRNSKPSGKQMAKTAFRLNTGNTLGPKLEFQMHVGSPGHPGVPLHFYHGYFSFVKTLSRPPRF